MGRDVIQKPRDPQGRHVRIYCTLLDSPAWRALGWSSRALFIDMRASVNGSNNGVLSATLATLKHRGWKSSATLANALFQLQALGFIAKTRGGGVEQGSTACSLYRFTDLDMYEFPMHELAHRKASHDYLKFATFAEAKRALREASGKRRDDADRTNARRELARARKKTTVQRLNCDASVSEAEQRFVDSVSEAEQHSTVQILKQTKGASKRPKPQAP